LRDAHWSLVSDWSFFGTPGKRKSSAARIDADADQRINASLSTQRAARFSETEEFVLEESCTATRRTLQTAHCSALSSSPALTAFARERRFFGLHFRYEVSNCHDRGKVGSCCRDCAVVNHLQVKPTHLSQMG